MLEKVADNLLITESRYDEGCRRQVHGVRGIGERSVHWREKVYAKDDDGRI